MIVCTSITILLSLHCKSERPALALKMGSFRCLKYSPIFESHFNSSLREGADLDPRAEIGSSVG